MIEVSFARRAGSLRRIWLAVLVWSAAAALPGRAPAQVPDTVVRRDTIRVPIPPEAVEADTLPRDSLPSATPDSLREAANLPRFGATRPEGFAFGRWVLTRDELLRNRVLSLAGLLERIPGVSAVRTGGFGTPTGFATLGAAGGRLRVFRDGYELDPFGAGATDLQQIGLIDVETVRVERTPAELRVHLESFRLPDARPDLHLRVRAGNYDTKMLRAILSRAVGTRAMLAGSYDLVATDGATPGIREPFQFSGGRLALGYALWRGTGMQVELGTAGGEREGNRFPQSANRRDLVVRGRSELRPGLSLDLAIGRSSWTRGDADSLRAQAAPGTVPVDTAFPGLSAVQALARAAYTHALGDLEVGARLRRGERRGFATPDDELFARLTLRPLPLLALDGEARSAGYAEGRGTETMVTAAVGPWLGVSLFASAGTGERWLGTARDTTVLLRDTLPNGSVQTRREVRALYAAVPSTASGRRVGVEWRGVGAHAGVALVALDPTTVVPFGLGFDRGAAPEAVEGVDGFEAAGSLPVPFGRGALRVDGAYSRWLGEIDRPYLPREQLRASVEFHRVFLDGQLEPTLRMEGEFRGSALAPGEDGSLRSAAVDPYSLVHLYLQIRIQDVRAFLRWENLLNAGAAADVPGLPHPGPRIVYGGRWFFRN